MSVFQAARVTLFQANDIPASPFRFFRIAPVLKYSIQNVAVLINNTPQIELPAFDIHGDVVQMPDIAGLRLSAAQAARNVLDQTSQPIVGWPRRKQ